MGANKFYLSFLSFHCLPVFFPAQQPLVRKKRKENCKTEAKKGQFRVCGIPLVGGHKLTPPLPKRIRTHTTHSPVEGKGKEKRGKGKKEEGGGPALATTSTSAPPPPASLPAPSSSSIPARPPFFFFFFLLLLRRRLRRRRRPLSAICYSARVSPPPRAPSLFALWCEIHRLQTLPSFCKSSNAAPLSFSVL